MKKYVKYLKNIKSDYLQKNKIYIIIVEDDSHYHILNDKNLIFGYFKYKFEVVTRKHKISKLL